MKTRWLLAGLAVFFLSPSGAHGQFTTHQPWVMPPVDPRERRLLRERAVLHAGPSARAFVESEFGDDAALALLACFRNAAVQLAAFYVSGGFSTLPRQRDFLRVIAQPDCRDAVALWVVQHAAELADPDCADVFLVSPLEYSLGLKQLSAAAKEKRGQRFVTPGPSKALVELPHDAKSLAWGAGLIGLIGLLVWRKHRQRARDSPA
jgi:hypothetical protein